jgi:cytochrome P450
MKELKGFHLITHLLSMKKNYAKSYYKLFQEYGDIVRLDRPWKMVIVSDSELARKILMDDSNKFTISNLAADLIPLMGKGMITSDGEEWISQKRLVSSSFSAKQIELFEPKINKIASGLLQEVKDGSVNLSEIILSYTYQVIAGMVFSNSLKGDLKQLEYAISYSLRFISKRQAAMFKPSLLLYPKFNKQINYIDQLLLESTNKPETGSLLEKLCENYNINTQAGRKQLRDQIVTLFITGHETTANTLIWSLYYILKNKLCTSRIVADDEYLDAILKETMRLYPAAPVSPRNLKVDYTYNEHQFKAGEEFLVSSFNLHRHPNYWKNPNKFNEKNFLNQSINTDYYFPFGRGKRSCIGEHLANSEMKIFIRQLFSHFKVEVPKDFKVCDFDASLTLRPTKSLIPKLVRINP